MKQACTIIGLGKSIHPVSKIPHSKTGKVANFETISPNAKKTNIHVDICD
jgi:hypothetical protein